MKNINSITKLKDLFPRIESLNDQIKALEDYRNKLIISYRNFHSITPVEFEERYMMWEQTKN